MTNQDVFHNLFITLILETKIISLLSNNMWFSQRCKNHFYDDIFPYFMSPHYFKHLNIIFHERKYHFFMKYHIKHFFLYLYSTLIEQVENILPYTSSLPSLEENDVERNYVEILVLISILFSNYNRNMNLFKIVCVLYHKYNKLHLK